MSGVSQVTTALEDQAAATALATTLVQEHLAACAQVIGPVASVFHWEGSLRTATEWLLVAKTSDERVPELMTRIRALHPYQVPEILAVPVTAGDADYLAWIRQETLSPTGEVR